MSQQKGTAAPIRYLSPPVRLCERRRINQPINLSPLSIALRVCSAVAWTDFLFGLCVASKADHISHKGFMFDVPLIECTIRSPLSLSRLESITLRTLLELWPLGRNTFGLVTLYQRFGKKKQTPSQWSSRGWKLN